MSAPEVGPQASLNRTTRCHQQRIIRPVGGYDKGWVCLGVGMSRESGWVCQWGGYVEGMGMSSGWACPVGGCIKGVRVGMFSDGYVPGGWDQGWVCPEGVRMFQGDLSHDACDVTCIHTCNQTDACENITFPQVLLWVIRTW